MSSAMPTFSGPKSKDTGQQVLHVQTPERLVSQSGLWRDKLLAALIQKYFELHPLVRFRYLRCHYFYNLF